MLRMLALCALVLCSILGASSSSLANGCKFPEAAYPAIPSIPVQRAMIVHRNGEETLIVESSYETPSLSVGWILPLPAEPSKLDVADAGLLTSLSMSLRPRVTHDLDGLWVLPALVLAIVALFCLTIISKPQMRGLSAAGVGLILMFLFLLASIMLPSLGTVGGLTPVAGVRETVGQRVGNYEVSVLRADRAAALSDWLTANGLLSLSGQAIPIVDDYIARKWCFVVARLRRDAAGVATPHPILATFPCASPIYPMKLTGLAPGKTQVELFVIADQQASAGGFKVVAADRFTHHAGEGEYVGDASISPYWQGSSTGLIVGHADAVSRMWNGCIVTRLSAELGAGQMGQDIDLGLAPCQSYREQIYSVRARGGVFRAILVYGGFPVLGFSTYIFRRRRRATQGELKVLLGVILVPLSIALVVFAVFPTSGVRASSGLNPRLLRMRSSMLLGRVQRLWGDGQITATTRPDQLVEILGDDIGSDRWVKNPFTGQRPTSDRSPGNFFLRTDKGQTAFCLYDEEARELRLRLVAGPSTVPSAR